MEYLLLKDIRENNDSTQQEIADILNVKRGTYASWECENDTIPTKKLYIFANYYKKSIDYLVGISNQNIKVDCNFDINLLLIGNNLKKLRQKLNLSQSRIANSIDINQSTWWAYENGKTLITTTSLISLAKKYNVSIDLICGRKNK